MILALFIGVLIGGAPFMFVLWKRKKRFGKFEAEMPEALDMMVSALRRRSEPDFRFRPDHQGIA